MQCRFVFVFGNGVRSAMRFPLLTLVVHFFKIADLLQATVSHVAVLVPVFDFGGDPAGDFVRMRMEPPFG
jgi:hypothetical protein